MLNNQFSNKLATAVMIVHFGSEQKFYFLRKIKWMLPLDGIAKDTIFLANERDSLMGHWDAQQFPQATVFGCYSAIFEPVTRIKPFLTAW